MANNEVANNRIEYATDYWPMLDSASIYANGWYYGTIHDNYAQGIGHPRHRPPPAYAQGPLIQPWYPDEGNWHALWEHNATDACTSGTSCNWIRIWTCNLPAHDVAVGNVLSLPWPGNPITPTGLAVGGVTIQDNYATTQTYMLNGVGMPCGAAVSYQAPTPFTRGNAAAVPAAAAIINNSGPNDVDIGP
jgi:hypothetical protein